MGKYGRDKYDRDHTIAPAPPGTDPGPELREAEQKKVELALTQLERARDALLRDDYDDALVFAQVACSAIVLAGGAAQIVERYYTPPAGHLASGGSNG